MTITEEKDEIIKRIHEEGDLSVIHAIKDLMDTIHDEALEKELNIAITEADNGEGIPHEEVWAEIKSQSIKFC